MTPVKTPPPESGPRRSALLLALLFGLIPGGAEAQGDLHDPPFPLLDAPTEAVPVISPHADSVAAPTVAHLLDRARRHLDRGWAARKGDDRLEHYRAAEELARRARIRAPGDPDAAWWLVAALGLRAQEEAPGDRVALVREIRREARRLVRMAPGHPGGHHALGRLHASVLRPGRLARWMARAAGAGDLIEEASWEEAEAHLRRAVELEPDAPHHHVELARILKDRGRKGEARAAARSALAASDDVPLARWYKGWARELLDCLG